MARFRLTVEVGSVRPVARRPLRRPRRPSPISVFVHRIRAVRLPSRRVRTLALLVTVLATAFSVWNYVQPLAAVAGTSSRPIQYVVPGSPPGLPWPDVGSAAVGASNLGLIATSGDVGPTPAASLAKVMTALIVLADKPMALGDSGPTIVITGQDVAAYMADAKGQQSVVAVAVGEKLNEYQALEAMLVGSGNNIAETLARWDAGSEQAFVARMNQRATQLQLTHTNFADPAGISLQTVTTPGDEVTLGLAAMQQDVVAQIVSLPQSTLPVAGTVYNVNSALGVNGIVGIKTGFGLNLGANFLFAAAARIDGEPVTLVGCLMGQQTLDAAFTGAEALIGAMKSALRVRLVVARGGVVGSYSTSWGSRSDVVATKAVTLVEWPGMRVRQEFDAPALVVDHSIPAGISAGNLQIVLGAQELSVPVVTKGSLEPPGLTWRLWRITLG
jgi:serine-type D-Ala-D-Ala carboxypeptidase (penicillin-binding protein 5/6)